MSDNGIAIHGPHNGNGHARRFELADARPDAMRRPPSNLDAERGVLASILYEPERLDDVAGILTPDDFYSDAHAEFYRGILALRDAGRSIDLTLLVDELERGGTYEQIGGDRLMDAVMDGANHGACAVEFAEVVRGKALGRRMLDAFKAAERELYSNLYVSQDVLARTIASLQGTAHDAADSGTILLGSLVGEVIAEIEQRRNGETLGIPTGFRCLDGISDGLQKQELLVIAGRPSMGKSALAMNIGEHIAFSWGQPWLFVSLEMGSKSLVKRCLSCMARIPAWKFRNGVGLTPEEYRRLCEARAKLENGPLHLLKRPSSHARRVTQEIRAAKARHGIVGVAVDYVQLIKGDDPNKNETKELDDITKALKDLAVDLDMPVILLSQLNRGVESRTDKRPMMSDLRGSGAIEQHADGIWMLYRPEYYNPDERPGEADVIIAKNRNGDVGTETLVFHRDITRFEDKPQAAAPPIEAFDRPF